MKFTAAEKAMLYREMAKLIGADFHVDRAVALLLGQQPSGGKKMYLEGLQRGLEKGAGVAAALKAENAGLIDLNPHPLLDAAQKPINHPSNLLVSYQKLAELRGMTQESLAEQIEINFQRLFL